MSHKKKVYSLCGKQDASLTNWLSGGQNPVWGGALPNQLVFLISSCFITSLVVGSLSGVSMGLLVVRLDATFASLTFTAQWGSF